MFLQGATDEERRSKAKARTTKGAWWRLWIPKAVLRTVFTDSTMSMRQAARTHKAAHSHVTNTVLSTAQVQHSLQKSQLESFTQEGVHDVQWLIYTLQFDETEFSVASGDPSLVSERPLFTQHGRIQWREASSTETFCEECVYPPTALEAKTADNMLEAIRRKHDGVILGLMQNTPLGCMLVNCDSVSSNLKVVRLIFNMFLPATAMLLFCRCLQHQASLIISTITVHQQFLTGLFCTARQLQKGSVLDGVEAGPDFSWLGIETKIKTHMWIEWGCWLVVGWLWVGCGLVCWLVGWLVVWLVGWLVGWLTFPCLCSQVLHAQEVYRARVGSWQCCTPTSQR